MRCSHVKDGFGSATARWMPTGKPVMLVIQKMRWVQALRNSACRQWYYFAMYSGMRAFMNRAKSSLLALDPEIEALHGVRESSKELGDLVLYVHSRVRPSAANKSGNFGVFSLRQSSPNVGRWTNQFFCLTSHFGCGHVEIAFFENDGEVTFYGIRNIASANAHRLGFSGLSARFRLAKSGEDALVLRFISKFLEEKGFAAKHATAHDCVNFAVDNRLLPRESDVKVKTSLYQKYERLCVVVNDN